MWLSTKRKRKDESSPSSASSRESSSGTSGDTRSGCDWQSSLPLDWTRMNRRNQVIGGDKGDFCCVNPDSCRRRSRIRPLTTEIREKSPIVTTTINGNDDGVVTETSKKIDGRAIFCLHDDDPSWIQGYFISRGSKKPWGMLAIQEEVDDCMACSTGGYRRLSLTVYHRSHGHHRQFSSKTDSSHSDSIRTKTDDSKNDSCKIDDVDWTGGDMMTLCHPRYVDMEAERLLTGKKALPMMHKYFQGLLNRLEEECHVTEGSSVLDWLPNVAIVTGPMTLTLPIQ